MLSLILISLPLLWLTATVLVVAVSRAASRADARECSGASRRGSHNGSPAARSERETYGFAVSQGV